MQFLFPVEKLYITQKYGAKSSRYASGFHMGLDIRAAKHTPIFAAQSGTVVVANDIGPFDGYGGKVVIDHGDKTYTVYGHLDKVWCKVGDTVEKGQQIGLSGGRPGDYPKTKGFTKAGNSSGYHLHWEADRGGIGAKFSYDPTPFTTHDPDIHKKYLISSQLKTMAQQVSAWAIDAQRRLLNKGVTDGSRPKDKITREEAWVMFDRVLALIDKDYVKKA